MGQNHMYHLPSEWIQSKPTIESSTESEVFMADAYITDKESCGMQDWAIPM
jgi:hypothetical protein